MTAPEIARIEQKIDDFMSAQEKTNERLSSSIEKISDAIARSQAQQVEINQLRVDVEKTDSKQASITEKISRIESNQAVTAEFKTQVTWLMRISIGALVTGVIGLLFWLVKGG